MAVAKLAKTQRQVAVTLDTLLVYQNVPRTVHRLERIVTLLRLGREHVFAVFVPVAGLFPK